MVIVNLVDGADIWMIQRGRSLRFALEAGERLLLFSNVIRQELQRPQSDAASRPRPCTPHPSHRRLACRRSGSARWFDRSRGQVHGATML